MATVVAPDKLQPKDFKPEVPPDWCPGCGDFGVLNALFQACAEIDLPPRDLLVVSGIGCSSNLPGFIRAYGVHSLHGRAVPFATGAKLANHAMTVIATGGDGDGYGIGLNHFIQAMRRNIDVTYIVMNNEIYGLTTGQVSPTSETGMKTKTTPHGNLEQMLNPMALALASGCGYIARGFSGQPKHLMKLYVDGIRHPGFALIDVFSPCVTFNKLNTYPWFKERVYKLEDEPGYDSTDLLSALGRSLEFEPRIPIGLLYKTERPTYEDTEPVLRRGPLVDHPLGLDRATLDEILAETM